jgi:hypothetical protein
LIAIPCDVGVTDSRHPRGVRTDSLDSPEFRNAESAAWVAWKRIQMPLSYSGAISLCPAALTDGSRVAGTAETPERRRQQYPSSAQGASKPSFSGTCLSRSRTFGRSGPSLRASAELIRWSISLTKAPGMAEQGRRAARLALLQEFLPPSGAGWNRRAPGPCRPQRRTLGEVATRGGADMDGRAVRTCARIPECPRT